MSTFYDFDETFEAYRASRINEGPPNLQMAMINHPNCCKPGQRFLGAFKTLAKAWDRCDNPFFVAWCLDYMLEYRLEPQYGELGLEFFYMRSWRMVLYMNFIEHELHVPKFLLKTAYKFLKYPKVSLFFYWLTNGYAEDRKTGWWWPLACHQVKRLRSKWIFLEVDKNFPLD